MLHGATYPERKAHEESGGQREGERDKVLETNLLTDLWAGPSYLLFLYP